MALASGKSVIAILALLSAGGVVAVVLQNGLDPATTNGALPTSLPEPAPVAASPAADTTDAPDTADVADAADVSEDETAVVLERVAPQFDLVRAEPSGFTLVSGTTSGSGHIAILSGSGENGKVLEEQETSGDGSFAMFLDLDLQPGGDVVTLVLRHRFDGGEIYSSEEVLISPPPLPANAEQETSDQASAVSEEPVQSSGDDHAENADASAADPIAAADNGPEQPDIVQKATDIVDELPQSNPDTTVETSAATAAIGLEAPKTVQQAPTVLLNSTEGVDVLQAAPLAPSQIALDAISYVGDDLVQISGRGQEDATVRIYLDNDPIEAASVEADGRWRINLPDVDAGTYNLRVDQVAGSGEVIARVETPFKREDPEVLAQALEAAEIEDIGAITVQPGSSLWAIARDRYGDGLAYVSVFEANASLIRDPNLIYPGQVFTLPETLDTAAD